jgi:hypothetical protein
MFREMEIILIGWSVSNSTAVQHQSRRPLVCVQTKEAIELARFVEFGKLKKCRRPDGKELLIYPPQKLDKTLRENTLLEYSSSAAR